MFENDEIIETWIIELGKCITREYHAEYKEDFTYYAMDDETYYDDNKLNDFVAEKESKAWKSLVELKPSIDYLSTIMKFVSDYDWLEYNYEGWRDFILQYDLEELIEYLQKVLKFEIDRDIWKTADYTLKLLLEYDSIEAGLEHKIKDFEGIGWKNKEEEEAKLIEIKQLPKMQAKEIIDGYSILLNSAKKIEIRNELLDYFLKSKSEKNFQIIKNCLLNHYDVYLKRLICIKIKEFKYNRFSSILEKFVGVFLFKKIQFEIIDTLVHLKQKFDYLSIESIWDTIWNRFYPDIELVTKALDLILIKDKYICFDFIDKLIKRDNKYDFGEKLAHKQYEISKLVRKSKRIEVLVKLMLEEYDLEISEKAIKELIEIIPSLSKKKQKEIWCSIIDCSFRDYHIIAFEKIVELNPIDLGSLLLKFEEHPTIVISRKATELLYKDNKNGKIKRELEKSQELLKQNISRVIYKWSDAIQNKYKVQFEPRADPEGGRGYYERYIPEAEALVESNLAEIQTYFRGNVDNALLVLWIYNDLEDMTINGVQRIGNEMPEYDSLYHLLEKEFLRLNPNRTLLEILHSIQYDKRGAKKAILQEIIKHHPDIKNLQTETIIQLIDIHNNSDSSIQNLIKDIFRILILNQDNLPESIFEILNNDWTVRKRKLQNLGDLKKINALAELKLALADENDEVKRHALVIIEKLGDEAIDLLPILKKMFLDEKYEGVYRDIFDTFKWIGKYAYSSLIDLLHYKDLKFPLRYKMVEIGNDITSDLILALKSDDVEFKCIIIDILGEISDISTLDYLIKLLKNKNTDIRIAAIKAIGKYGEKAKKASNALTKFLVDKNYNIRMKTVEALGEIKDIDTLPEIIKMLNDKNKIVRSFAVNSIEEFEEKAFPAIPNLIDLMLKEEDEQIKFSISSILLIFEEKSIPAYIKAIKEGNLEDRIWAAERLGDQREKAKQAIPVLLETLEEDNEKLNYVATEALEKIEKDEKRENRKKFRKALQEALK